MISGSLGLQRLEVRLGVPEFGARLWQLKHQILATRPVVSDKGPGPLALQKRIPTKTESSETRKVFIKKGKKVQYVWMDTQADSEGESLSCTLMAI